MKLIVGLGNPGTQYAKTRHNAGRVLVETIARRQKLQFSEKKSLFAGVASFDWEGVPVVLSYPTTYMNESGKAVACLLAHFGVKSGQDLLVVVDDAALPFGKLRLRKKGSDGGHNGLKSIEQVLAVSDYPRLRIGIGPFEETAAAPFEEYVLSAWTPGEKKALPDVLEKAGEACRLWVTQPIEAAMNAVNPDKEKS